MITTLRVFIVVGTGVFASMNTLYHVPRQVTIATMMSTLMTSMHVDLRIYEFTFRMKAFETHACQFAFWSMSMSFGMARGDRR